MKALHINFIAGMWDWKAPGTLPSSWPPELRWRFWKFSESFWFCLFPWFIFTAASCLPGVLIKNTECSQHIRHLTYCFPFYPYTVLFKMKSRGLEILKNLLSIHHLPDKSKAGIQLILGPQTTKGPWAPTVNSSTLPSCNGQFPNSQCLPLSLCKLLCLLSKWYLESNIWGLVLLIAMEMPLLPGSFRRRI